MSLTREQGIELKAVLDDRRHALLGELREDTERARREGYGEVAGPVPDPGDASVADLIADLGQAGISRDLAELREVEAARERMVEGSYGSCIECGAEIDYRRLRAYPSALRCIDCQRRVERASEGERPTL
jgi:RNA polymerase-binding transcription factor DksA